MAVGSTFYITSTRHDAPAPERATTTTTAGGDDGGRPFWGKDGFTFGDILDAINPLQHLPVVSTAYRAATEDAISPGARILGGALFGGIFGLFGAVFNAVVEQATGRDIGANIVAMFEGDDGPAGAVTVAAAPSLTTRAAIEAYSTTAERPIRIAAARFDRTL